MKERNPLRSETVADKTLVQLDLTPLTFIGEHLRNVGKIIDGSAMCDELSF
ncbi:hypothetical protein [Pantoea sp.]|uniref:hypothetical protein n=1 Tax=Pantoea sp. TaxID=69393 RepID=UPI0028AD5B52|nr:hypothetical protein [Pantoea sp.]